MHPAALSGIGLAARGGGALAIAAYAALAMVSGLDRASAADPGLASRVPPGFAAEALLVQGRAALERGDGKEAMRLGAAVVAKAPLDPAATALLGAGRLAIGDRAGADQAMRISAQLGWRIPYTQLYMMGRALEVGDFRVAALRFDAMARQQPGLVRERRLLDPLERDPRGRTALAERLRANPPWLRGYGMNVRNLPPDVIAQRALVLDEMARQGGSIGCEAVGPTVSALIAHGAVSDAARLWRAHCPGAAASLLYDGKFMASNMSQTASEFAWTFIGQSDASLVLDRGNGQSGGSVTIDSNGHAPLLLLRQLVLVAPGTYDLSWSAADPSGNPSNAVAATLSCNADPREWFEGTPEPGTTRRTVHVVVDASCSARWLGFAAMPGASGVRLSDVRLNPVP